MSGPNENLQLIRTALNASSDRHEKMRDVQKHYEEAVKVVAVIPVLHSLGFDLVREIRLEATVGTGHVDILVQPEPGTNRPSFFVEVKSPKKNIARLAPNRDAKPVEEYLEACPLGMVTDGFRAVLNTTAKIFRRHRLYAG